MAASLVRELAERERETDLSRLKLHCGTKQEGEKLEEEGKRIKQRQRDIDRMSELKM